MKWFVYSNTTYYPYAIIVEADDVDGALRAAQAEDMDIGVVEGVAVFPLDSLANWSGERPIEELQ